jgi:hypothetical protein
MFRAGRTAVSDAPGGAGPGAEADSDARRPEAPWRLAAWLLLGAVLLLIVSTFRDYGLTWDEAHSATNGRYWIDFYASWFTARGAIDDNNQRLYGSFFNGISRLIADRSPLGLYETGHLVTALSGWLGFVGVYWLGSRLLNARAGFFAALALILTPGWYGHLFNNPKDVPFGTLFLLALCAMVATYRSLPSPRPVETLGVGAAVGLAMGVRVGAIALLGCYALLFACWAAARIHEDPTRFRRLWRDGLAFAPAWAGALVVAWAVMLPWWPYAQRRPLVNPWKALGEIARFEWTGLVLYDGAFVNATALPWHYLPRWFAITLPDFYAVILPGVGLAWLFARWSSRRAVPDRDLRAQTIFLLMAMLGLPAAAAVTDAVLYDAYRHFIFVLPPLAVVTGCGLSSLLDRPRAGLKATVAAAAAVLAALTVADMVALHPYQSVYFNRLHGGLKAAFGAYETDYWGASHREGVEWLAAHYRRDAPAQSIRVANTADEELTGYYIRTGDERMRRFVSVPSDKAPDVILSTTRWNRHEEHDGRVVHRVERMGVPLLFVIERTPARHADESAAHGAAP